MRGKRGQMEIMGLTIIVILVILGVLFGIRVMSKPPIELEKEFKEKTMSVNYLNTLLGTTTDCYKGTFRELIQDCGQAGGMTCSITGVGYLRSCDYVDLQFDILLNQTLGGINKRYFLSAEGPGGVQDIQSGAPCPGERSRGTQYVPTRRGTVTLTLDLCS